MSKGNSFLLSTTSTLEGYLIKEYLGTVSAHVAAGTGFFSDFTASFSDFFGGRSQTYQKQLQNIQTHVLKTLEENAKRQGANAVIGIRIDQDEISGKGKQMFMVTAVGTAVSVEKLNVNSIDSEKKSNSIDGSEVNERIKVKWALDSLKSKDVRIDENTWAIIAKRQEFQVLEPALDLLFQVKRNSQNEYMNYGEKDWERFLNYRQLLETNTKDLLMNISQSISTAFIYEYLKKDKNAFGFFEQIIIDGNLIDLEQIKYLLSESDFHFRKKILKLLLTEKEYYTPNDIQLMEALIEKINSSFNDLSTSKEGGVFSKKEKWICSGCKNTNDETQTHCSSCDKDRLGFSSKEKNPVMIISLLQEKITVLKEEFLLN